MAREVGTISDILKDIKKKYGETVATVGAEDLRVDGILSLGSPSLDFAIYGGVPEGRIVELSGAEGSGKTTNAFLIAASYQREELKRNSDSPRYIVYIDQECTADPTWALKMGYDMGENAKVKTILLRPEGQSAEEVFDMALDLLKTGDVGLIIIDSIATLVPQQIVDESMEKYQMGGIAKSLTRFANTAVGLLRKYKATLIGINQVRDNMSGYGDATLTPGGRAWKHQCSMRLMFKRGTFFDEDGNELTKSAQSPAGHVIEVYLEKIKTARWDRKLGTTNLNYAYGLDIMQDTIDTAIRLGLIDNSTQGSFRLVDPDTGEVLTDEEGNELKIRGKKNIKPYFNEHPELFKSLYNKCYEMMERKEDTNIVSFERLLGIDVDQVLTNDENIDEKEVFPLGVEDETN